MIIGMFVYALIFIAAGVIFLVKKKKLVAGMFFLLALLLAVVGAVAISLYPHIWPF
jgi:cytochrome bd-type quinol oxidase subunit 2